MNIRKAIAQDIERIQTVARITWNKTYEGIISLEAQDAFLNNAYSDAMMLHRVEHTLLLVAEINGSIAGFANFSEPDADSHTSALLAIYILPEYQNNKLGTRLLMKGLEMLTEAERLVVEVEKENAQGRSFYEAKGFKIEREYIEEFFGHQLMTVEMSLKIEAGKLELC